MNLMRWDPMRELEDMSERLNRFFTRGAPPAATGNRRELMTMADWTPLVDVKEKPEEYLIKAELPDVKKEDVKVAIVDGVLTISGERKMEKEENGEKFHRIERAYGKFVRSFGLPEDVDDKKLAAVYKDGLLEVHLPKAPGTKPRAVDIKVN